MQVVFHPPQQTDTVVKTCGGQTVSVPTVRYECLVTTRRQLEYARQMRRQSTRAEIYLWQHVRGKQLGVRFRRQHPIGPYIADFACVAGGHNFRPARETRLKYRYYHQHRGFMESFEEPKCVGCGRCSRVCLAGINPPDVIRDLQDEERA